MTRAEAQTLKSLARVMSYEQGHRSCGLAMVSAIEHVEALIDEALAFKAAIRLHAANPSDMSIRRAMIRLAE